MCYRVTIRLVTALFAVALLTSCAVGPDYVRPKAPVPEVFKETDGWKTAQPRDDAVKGPWWEVFGDTQLNALLAEISINNQNVLQAEAQFRQAQALVQFARAAYFPYGTAGGSYTRSLKSSNAGQATSTSATSDHLLSLSLSWEIDLWGRIRRSVEASRASLQASAADLEAVRLAVQAELAQDYFQLRTLDRTRQLLDETVLAYKRSLELTQNRYAGGVASKADVLQAESQLKATEAQALDVSVQRAQTEHAIALLLGKPASLFSIPVAPLDILPPPVPVGLPSDLLERRPDIAAAERRVAAANAQIGIARAAYYPRLILGGAGGLESNLLADLFKWPSRFWAVGPALTESIYTGGTLGALTDQARAIYDGAVASYRQTVLTGFREVEDNLAALRILEQEAAVQDEAVRASRHSVEIALNQYKAGTLSYLAVIVLQAAALNNERTAVNILGRRMAAAVMLIKALGGGWNIPAAPDRTAPHQKP